MAGPAFHIFRIPVRIEPTFFVIVAVLGFTGDLAFLLIWIPVVTVSVLVHELGHGVAFRAFGKQPQIVLQGMGGLTSAPGRLAPSRELVVSLAGPLTGLVLIGLPALWLEARVPDSSSDLDLALRVLVFVNIAWSIVNLLPVLPLDGGRVTASVIQVVTRRPPDRGAHAISVAVAGAAALWAYAQGEVFIALFAGFFVAYNLAQLSQLRAQRWTGELFEGYRMLVHGDEDRALERARTISASSSSGPAVAQALDLEAWVHLKRGDPDGVETALRRRPPRVPPNPFLTACLALAAARDDGLDGLASAYTGKDYGPWSPIAADLVARAGATDALVERLVSTGGDTSRAALARLQSDLHHAGRYGEAVGVGERAFPLALEAGAPNDAAMVAYNVACSLVRGGRTTDAMAWLERAIRHGFTNRDLLESDPDLEPLRHTAGFETLRRGLS